MGMDTYKSFVLNSPNAYKDDSVYNKQKNRALYQKYVNNYLAEQQRDEQLAQIKKSKESALSESAIASERARKYVDAVNKHLGIAGTGYGESKAIDLYAQEAKRRAEINNAHSEQENEALKAYKQAIANAELAESEAMGNIELAEDQENEAKRQAYVAKLQELNDNPETTNEDFSRYYKEYAQYLGEDDKLLKEDLEAKDKIIQAKSNKDAVAAEVAKKGVKLGNAVALEELINDKSKLGSFKDTGEQTALINAIITAANASGVDSLEGKAFDVNYGAGHDYYYYSNGVFYDISKADAKKLDIVEFDNNGNISVVRESNEKQEQDVNKQIAQNLTESFENGDMTEEIFNLLSESNKKSLVSSCQLHLTEDKIPDYIKNSKYW